MLALRRTLLFQLKHSKQTANRFIHSHTESARYIGGRRLRLWHRHRCRSRWTNNTVRYQCRGVWCERWSVGVSFVCNPRWVVRSTQFFLLYIREQCWEFCCVYSLWPLRRILHGRTEQKATAIRAWVWLCVFSSECLSCIVCLDLKKKIIGRLIPKRFWWTPLKWVTFVDHL